MPKNYTIYIIKYFFGFRWQNRFKSIGIRNLLILGFCVCHIIGNIIFTIFLLSAAIQNYPGGHAMMLLHKFESDNQDANYTIHIDNFSAQTGITRFTQLNNHWMYVI